MNRQPGFYWVKLYIDYDVETEQDIIEWTIAKWGAIPFDPNGGFEWMRIGWDVGMKDSDFMEIDEAFIRHGRFVNL